MVRGFALLLVVLASPAFAERKTIILSAGDCADPSLVSAAKDFRDSATKLLKEQLMEGDGVLDIVRPRPTRSLTELERQIDSARTLFYGGQPDRASELVDRALEELERASPETKPWGATVNALILKALIAKGADRTKDMNDAFRRIVRIDANVKLDPDAYPPSALTAFEAVKKDFVRAKKFAVLIRAETGTANIFIDGQNMGQSPLTALLIPGSYRVSLVSGSAVSFPHRVEVPRDMKLNVDLAFEGAIGSQPPLCLSGGADGAAVKLGQLVAAERVIVLRNVARRGEPPFLSGTVFDLSSGKQEREGSVQMEFVPNLATFLITGKDVLGVQRPNGTPVAVKKPEPEVKKEPLADTPPITKDPVRSDLALNDPPPPPPPPQDPPAGTTSTARRASHWLLGIGGGAAAIGIVAFSIGTIDRNRLAGLAVDAILPDPVQSPGPRAEAIFLVGATATNRAVSFALIGFGVGALISGAFGNFFFPESTTQVAVMPTSSGGAISVSGSF